MFDRQNRIVALCGGALTMMWAFVTAISKGLPLEWCKWIDHATLHQWTALVYKMGNGFYYDVRNNDMPTISFFVIFFFACILVYMAMRTMELNVFMPSTFALMIFFAVLFRLVLIPSEPIHENDFYRYLWDGKSAKHGINPFKYAPSDLFMYEHGYSRDYYDAYNEVTLKGKDFTEEDGENLRALIEMRNARPYNYARIGHWQVPTIYPPVAQSVFWLTSVLREDSYYLMKFIFILFDIGVIILTALLLKHFSLNPNMAIVYAWSPLVLKEYANSGHYDPTAIFFNMLAIYFFFKGRKALSVVGLAFGALTKFFSGFLIPLFLKRTNILWFGLFAAIFGAAYVPYFLWNDAGVAGVFEGLTTYTEEWSYNSSVFAVIFQILSFLHEPFSENLMPAKMIVGVLYLSLLFWLFWAKERTDFELLHRFFLATGALFVLNQVGDPWYFCWAIPFLCFFPYRSWLLLSATLIFSYINFQTDYLITDLKFLNISAVSWVVYLPAYSYMAWEAYRKPKFTEQFDTICEDDK